MGLTAQSTGSGALKNDLQPRAFGPGELVVALAGNPNTGKSTVFNSLTGLRQHTGNWPGKTVAGARGKYQFRGKNFILVDLPGTYSLLAHSVEEEVARDFICFGGAGVTVVVTDATCLERNLNLVLQILEITPRVVVCVNLMDEAARKKIGIDLDGLGAVLGVPVVGTNAREGRGLVELKEAVFRIAVGLEQPQPFPVIYEPAVEEAVRLLAGPAGEVLKHRVSGRWLALRLLENDKGIVHSLEGHLGVDLSRDPVLNILLEKAARKLGSNVQDVIATAVVRRAEEIAAKVVCPENRPLSRSDRGIDDLVTSRRWGVPIMVAMLGVVFWITISGSNYPSKMLAAVFFRVEGWLTALFAAAGWPGWLHGLLVLGVYRTLARVVSVMLPPMAIFFPLFTLLEDLGYLPRVAFNLDNLFKKARAHGKQALTMCMGFGCNAAGVISCRIINSPRERLIAVITNNFVPCNGRFPILITLSAIFIGGAAGGFHSLAAAAAVLGTVIFGVLITLGVSRLLSATILKGLTSSFILEMPPYRKPQVGRVLVRSLLDRTLFVLGRAVVVAAPAGLAIWLMANIQAGGMSLLDHGAVFLQPFAGRIGLDGYILMAFILGLPANEIVIPILIMSYLSGGAMLEPESLEDLRRLFAANGWTGLTAVCAMLFTLNHFPCGTTLFTIRRETQSAKWTLVSFLLPTLTGITVCFIVAQAARLLGLV
jgi:ferrous iron transport protein B